MSIVPAARCRRMVIVAVLVTTLAGCGAGHRVEPIPVGPAASGLRKFEFVRDKMGGPFRVALYASDAAAATKAADAAYARVDQLNAALSDYDPASEISRLSQRTADGAMSEPAAVSEDLFRVLQRGQEMSGKKR